MASRWRQALIAGLVALATTGVGSTLAAQRGDFRRAEPRSGSGVGITIFAQPNFQGPNATFRDDVSDLRKVNMNDRVDSLRIGRGEVWEVCENINYKGRCRVFYEDQADLARNSWGGMISSLRRLNANGRRGGGLGEFPPLGARSRLVLFDDTDFRGRSFAVTDTTPTLRALANRARSAKVYGGAWDLCDGDRFGGRCVTVTDSVPDLARLGMRDRVSSARPVLRR